MITSEAEQVADPERMGAEGVALHRDSVTIATHHLHDRLESLLDEDSTGRHRRHTHDGCLIVGHVDGVDGTSKKPCLLSNDFGVGTPGRTAFTGDDKLTLGQQPLECAS